ncbi:MAG: hypothetical protein ACK5XL_16475 [Cyclobacteriaceae bacterium]
MDSTKPYFVKKASVLTCLFLLAAMAGWSQGLSWKFSPGLQHIHQLILNLHTREAQELLSRPPARGEELYQIYLLSFSETLDVLISEDAAKFDIIDKRFKERLQRLEAMNNSPDALFLQAELHLQRGFSLLNLNQEVNAVFAIRKAYNLVQDGLKKYPDCVPLKKTSGVIQVMVGTVPDKYHWFIALLGMRGSVTVGQKQLNELRASASSLSVEAGILYYTIKGLINQQFPEAIQGILASLQQQPENKLLLFLGTNLLMKDARSEEALGFIKTLDQQTSGLPLHYIDYLHAEILLQKGEYDRAISHYLRFAAAYRSENFKKDAYYKISLAHWLNGNTDHAKRYFQKARKTGRSVAEPDRVAAAQLEEGRLPNAKLAKVRLATDGGYYTEARKLIDQIKLSDLTSLKEQAEYYYRKARLEHRTGNLAGAKVLYDQTISMAGQQPWYFAANASLQMGYICMDEKRFADAETYFNRALAYKKHEYKTSIDGKARSALETLKAKKLA